jgi:hypothetical protein
MIQMRMLIMVVVVVRMMMMRETMKQYKTSINILDTMVRIRMLLMTMAPHENEEDAEDGDCQKYSHNCFGKIWIVIIPLIVCTHI